MRALTFVLVGLAAFLLCGCARSRLDATPSTNWTVRDRELLAITPYAQASIPQAYRRHLVDYHRQEAPGTIVVDTDRRYLYYVLPQGQAIRYGVTVGEGALAWSGVAKVGRMQEWPVWPPRRCSGLRESRTAQSDGGASALPL